MSEITICTFNVENLFLRYKFSPLPPGIISDKPPENELIKGIGYLPLAQTKDYDFYKEETRILTALALTRGKTIYPDICCLQEVESMQALRRFNQNYLSDKNNKNYPYALLIDSHDPRLIDVGILSIYPITNIISHIDEKDDRGYYLFSRDCLEVTFDIKGTPLTIFVNHLKSKFGKKEENSDKRRKSQAERIAQILKQRFPDKAYGSEKFIVLGDFNDYSYSDTLSPILRDAGLENVIERLPDTEHWTHWYDSKNLVGQLDYILTSPALSKKNNGLPYIERRGISSKRKKSYLALPDEKKGQEIDFSFKRFDGVTDDLCASDHCPVFFELNIG